MCVIMTAAGVGAENWAQRPLAPAATAVAATIAGRMIQTYTRICVPASYSNRIRMRHVQAIHVNTALGS